MLRRSAERGERPVRPLRSKSFSINAEVDVANGNTATVELPTSTSRWRRSLSTCVQGLAPSTIDAPLPIKPASPPRHGAIEQDTVASRNIIGNLATGTASPPRNRTRPQLRRASVPKNVSFAPASVSRKLRPRVYSSPSQDIYVRHEPAVVIIDPDVADMNTSSEDSMVRVFTRASFESQADVMSWRGSDSSAPTSPRPPSPPSDEASVSPAKGPAALPPPVQTPLATRRRTLGLRSGITGTPSRTSLRQPHVSLSSSGASPAPATAPLSPSAKAAIAPASSMVTHRLRSRPASPVSPAGPPTPVTTAARPSTNSDTIHFDVRPLAPPASPRAGCEGAVAVDALDAAAGLDWSMVDSDAMHLAFAGHSTVKPARTASKLAITATTDDSMAHVATASSSSSSASGVAIPTRSRAGVFIPRETPRTADADECLWDIPSQRSAAPALPAAAASLHEEAVGDDSTAMSAGDLSAFLSRGDLRLPWADGSAALDASAVSDEVTLHLHLSPGTVTVDVRRAAATTTSAAAMVCPPEAPLSRSKRTRNAVVTTDEATQADGLDAETDSSTTARSKRVRRSHGLDTLNDSTSSTFSHTTVSASPVLHSPPTTRSRMRARAMTGCTSDASQASAARVGEADRSTSSSRARTKARSRGAARSSQDTARVSPSHTPTAPSAPVCYDARQLALAFPTAQLPASTLDDEQARAVDTLLGPCVANLGYKRIHVASARVLTSSVPVWCHQRPCDPDRVRAISEAFYHEGDMTVPQLLGTVCAYALPVGGRVEVGLFDGQHRVQAMALLLRRRQDDMVQSCLSRNEPPPTLDELMRIDFPIVVEVWGVRSQFHIAQLYRSVNLAEPVQDVDMHLPFLGYGDAAEAEVVQRNRSHKSLIAEAVGALADKHRAMFKISTRCVPPHVNADVMRNNVYVSQLCGVLNITTAAQLLQLLTTTNASLASVPAAHWPLRSRHAALAKARTHGFYLGLDNYAWLDALVERAEKGEVSPNEMEPASPAPAPVASGPGGSTARSGVDVPRTRATTGVRTAPAGGSHSTTTTHKSATTITGTQKTTASRLGARVPASRAPSGDTKLSSRK